MTQSQRTNVVVLDNGQEVTSESSLPYKTLEEITTRSIEEVTRSIVARVGEIHTQMIPIPSHGGNSSRAERIPKVVYTVLSNMAEVGSISFFGYVPPLLRGDQIRAYLVRGDEYAQEGDNRRYIPRDEFKFHETAVRIDRLVGEAPDVYEGIYFPPTQK